MKKVFISIIFFIATLAMADQYVAVVDGVTINFKTFNKMVQDSVSEYKKNLFLASDAKLSDEEIDSIKQSVLSTLIEDTMLASYAGKERITINETEIKKRINDLEKGFPSREEFLKTLKNQHITTDNLKSNIKKQITKDKIMASIYHDYEEISSQDILFYLKKNMLINMAVQYNLTLLVTDDALYLERLKDFSITSENWESLKIDKALSYFSKNISDEELPITIKDMIVVSELKKYSTIDTLEDNHYFMIMVNHIENISLVDTNSISASVRNALKAEKRNRYFNQWIEDQKAKSKILINQELIKKEQQQSKPKYLFQDFWSPFKKKTSEVDSK
ncbi:MAG: SurA N-terminal domain-containing protein [Candidatus Margulisbacteria bacterium]|nr:SurA N-terminal domain-containing protein [Candidatus Margulisiibacteriota bacterium]